MGKRDRKRKREAKEPVKPATPSGPNPYDETSPDTGKDGMTTQEIVAAGYSIDVPFEAPGVGDMQYADGQSLTDVYPELLAPDLGGKAKQGSGVGRSASRDDEDAGSAS